MCLALYSQPAAVRAGLYRRGGNMTLVVGRLGVIFFLWPELGLGLFAWLSISHDAAESLCLFVFWP